MYVEFWTSILNIEVFFSIRTSTPTSISYHYYILFLSSIGNDERQELELTWPMMPNTTAAYHRRYAVFKRNYININSPICDLILKAPQLELEPNPHNSEFSHLSIVVLEGPRRAVVVGRDIAQIDGYPSLPPKQVAANNAITRGWMTKFIHSLIALK